MSAEDAARQDVLPWDEGEPELPPPSGREDWTATRGILPAGLGPRTWVKRGDKAAQAAMLALNIGRH